MELETCTYLIISALTVNLTRGLHMTDDIFFSLMLFQLSELIPHTKRITSETLPKPLSAVPCIIKNTKKLASLYLEISAQVYQLREVGWLWWLFRDQHHRRHHQHIRSLLGIDQYTSKKCWRKKVIELENYLGLRGGSVRVGSCEGTFSGGLLIVCLF